MPERDLARLVLGTAALGVPYGLAAPGQAAPELLPEAQACAVMRDAFDAGVTTFDTAPAYGDAEARLGQALAGHGQIWTKVGREGLRSVQSSLAKLQRTRLDLVSWHNWTRSLADDIEFRECWSALRDHPAIAALGATTYGEDDAAAALESGLFDMVQVEWNLLRQGVLRRLRGSRSRTRIALRSVWLQGVLTPRSRALPAFLRPLESSVRAAAGRAGEWGLDLEALALRAALDQPGVDHVVVGLGSADQLAAALRAVRQPSLAPEQLKTLAALDRGDDPLTDPRTWAVHA